MTTTPQPTDGAVAQAFREAEADVFLRANDTTFYSGVYQRAAEIDATRYAKPEVDDAMVLRALLAGYPGKAAYSSADMTFMRAALEAALGKGGA